MDINSNGGFPGTELLTYFSFDSFLEEAMFFKWKHGSNWEKTSEPEMLQS